MGCAAYTSAVADQTAARKAADAMLLPNLDEVHRAHARTRAYSGARTRALLRVQVVLDFQLLGEGLVASVDVIRTQAGMK